MGLWSWLGIKGREEPPEVGYEKGLDEMEELELREHGFKPEPEEEQIAGFTLEDRARRLKIPSSFLADVNGTVDTPEEEKAAQQLWAGLPLEQKQVYDPMEQYLTPTERSRRKAEVRVGELLISFWNI